MIITQGNTKSESPDPLPYFCAFCGPLAVPHVFKYCPLVVPTRTRKEPPGPVFPPACRCASTDKGHDRECSYYLYIARD